MGSSIWVSKFFKVLLNSCAYCIVNWFVILLMNYNIFWFRIPNIDTWFLESVSNYVYILLLLNQAWEKYCGVHVNHTFSLFLYYVLLCKCFFLFLSHWNFWSASLVMLEYPFLKTCIYPYILIAIQYCKTTWGSYFICF